MRHELGLIAAIVLSGCAFVGSRVADATEVDIGALVESAEKYEGTEVTVCGWFAAEFEVCTLSASPYRDPASGDEIWVVPTSELCGLQQAVEKPVKGWASVKGRFHTGKQFGHLGSYKSIIDGADVQLQKAPCAK